MGRPSRKRKAALAASLATRVTAKRVPKTGAYGGVLSTSPLAAVARAGDVRAVAAPSPFNVEDDAHRPRKRRSTSSNSRAVPTDNEDPRIVELQLRWKAVLEWEVRRASFALLCAWRAASTRAPLTCEPRQRVCAATTRMRCVTPSRKSMASAAAPLTSGRAGRATRAT